MNPRQRYLESQVNSASPIGLIIMLYDGLLSFSDKAISGLKNGSDPARAEAAEAVGRCNKILTELNVSLRYEEQPEFSERMASLYEFFISKYNQAILEKKAAPIEEIIPLINELRDAWKEAEFKTQEQTPASSNTAPSSS
ncbi:MAG: flagellar export chaperone FliS [Verrucomicrobiota bacterium]